MPIALIVEDTEAHAYVLERCLSKMGLAVDVARTSEAGRVRARARAYDLVVIDLGLPDGDGAELCAEIKRICEASPPIVCATSADSGTHRRTSALDRGADCFLVQPLDEAEVHATVRALLRLRRVEQDLALARVRHAAALEAAPVVVFGLDLGGSLTWSQAGAAVSPGPAAVAALARNAAIVRLARDATATRAVVRDEVILADGSTWDVHVRPEVDRSSVVTGLMVTAYETTAVHRAEAARRHDLARLRLIVDANLIGVIVATLDGRLLEANGEALRLLGASDVTQIPRWDTITPSEHAAADARARDELLAMGRCTPFEKEYVRVDGTRVPVLVSIARLPDSDDDCIALLVDQSPIRDREIQMRRAVEDLDRYALVVAHDLQEPLRTVGSFAALLDRKLGALADEVVQRYLSFIRDGTARMTSMVKGILAFSRAGNEMLRLTAVRPDTIARDAILAVESALTDSSGHVSVQDMPPVIADASALGTVFQNLFSNAIKYRGSDAPRISVEAVGDGSVVHIHVADNARGIGEADRARVFRLYERLSQPEPGHGVGLASVKRVVERMGGTITLTSTPGSGSTFRISLPAASMPGSADCQEIAASPR